MSTKRKASLDKGTHEKKARAIAQCHCGVVVPDPHKAFWNDTRFYCSRECLNKRSMKCDGCAVWCDISGKSVTQVDLQYYCSEECLAVARIRRCAVCDAETKEQTSRVKGKVFCSDACEATYIDELLRTDLHLKCKDCGKGISDEGVLRDGDWQCLSCQSKAVGAQWAASARNTHQTRSKS